MCIRDRYVYRIMNTRIRDPCLQKRVCFYPAPLDIGRMQAAASAFEGTHDFAAVRSVGTETKTTVRTIYWCRAEKLGDEIKVAVCADGFLYNMVRAIVGTMVYASHGKLSPDEIPALLETRDRRLTGPTMPDVYKRQVVHLVDDEDDVAGLAYLLDESLHAALELAAELRSGHQRCEVEQIDLLVAQFVRHVAAGDALRQALGDGRLADARLADEAGVVLLAAVEDVYKRQALVV